MSNFKFLRAEFESLYDPAVGAEQLVYSDPRAACMRTRHALEQAVHWLYEHDLTLRLPYDDSLGVLLTQPAFEALVPPQIRQKTRLIQKLGNRAVHGSAPIRHGDSLHLVRELFHVMYWLARTFTRTSDPKSLVADWDEKRIPHLVNADQAVAFTRDELKKQEAQFKERLQAQTAQIEAREKQIAVVAATSAEYEARLAQLDAELARARAELATAKAANIAVPDTHDYSEAETRKRFIDVLLREAGWVEGDSMGVEVPLVGMPNKPGGGFADYVLWGQNGKPLAVVEAKRSFSDPEVGRQQAKLYADCLEQMKGQRPLIFYTNGHKTWLWDDTRAAPREVSGFYSRDELELAISRRSLHQDLRGLEISSSIVERAYQTRAIRAVGEHFMAGHRAALLTMATGTGKTRTAVALIDLLMRANWVKRVLFLADRVALVRQATNAFKAHLPDSSPVNLVQEKDGQGRVFLSTYPTMMGLIEEMDGVQRKYGAGYFDLIVIDEAHRSVYQKYGAIFRYFDAYLVGLTATPRDEVDRDTYQLFGLEKGVPTDAYSLNEAVADGYLVKPAMQSVPLKFVREGIKYDELSGEEKDHWESLDWGDEEAPDEVQASDVNKKLFNTDTVDKMLQHLMQHGIKVEGGDRLGKTIIFAVNQEHAQFIAKRFDHNYPQYQGHFARVITHAVTYAQSLIDDFSVAAKLPQIAISVDMLDTGIDVPEVVNLVFFKAVRSKVKFLQMIGRGTRLSKDLFGPGLDKTEFVIFDFCGNFEFFNENPAGAPSPMSEPLGKRLFKRRLELLSLLPDAPQSGNGALQEGTASYNALEGLQAALQTQLHDEVAAMNLDNFLVREQREHVSKFIERGRWNTLGATDYVELRDHVAGLPSQLPEEDITAKLFDMTCLGLQIAIVQHSQDFVRHRDRVIELAMALENVQSIPAVKQELPLIQEVQTEAYWQDITLAIIEHLRKHLRGLIQFIERKSIGPVYTDLQDVLGAASKVELRDFSTGINTAQYKRKVEAWIRANENHVAMAKLRFAKPLTPTDLTELERFVYEAEAVGGRDRFVQEFGEVSLPQFIRSLVGLDRNAAKEAFGLFLDSTRYNSQQIRFVEMIIERLTRQGAVDPGQLYDAPFTSIHHEGLDGAFRDADAEAIVGILDELARKAA